MFQNVSEETQESRITIQTWLDVCRHWKAVNPPEIEFTLNSFNFFILFAKPGRVRGEPTPSPLTEPEMEWSLLCVGRSAPRQLRGRGGHPGRWSPAPPSYTWSSRHCRYLDSGEACVEISSVSGVWRDTDCNGCWWLVTDIPPSCHRLICVMYNENMTDGAAFISFLSSININVLHVKIVKVHQ